MNRRAFAILFIAVVVVAAGGWIYADRHQVVPGLEGCQYVRDSGSRTECYAAEASSMMDEEGVEPALERIDVLAADVPSLRTDCHLALHVPGERHGRAAARDDGELPAGDASSWCRQGYRHGLLIGYFSVAVPDERLATEAAEACTGSELEVDNCVHAFGHMFAQSHEDDVDGLVRSCASLERAVYGKDWEVAPGVGRCMNGAFMEYALQARSSSRSTPGHDCAEVPEQAQPPCYDFLPARMAMMGADRDDLAHACERDVPAGQPRELCVLAVAADLRSPEDCTLFTRETAREICRAAPFEG